MVDEMIDLAGFREAWGHSVYQCPYCHGWEVRGQRWGYLALEASGLEHGFPAMLKGWTDDVVVFAGADVAVSEEIIADLEQRGVRFEPRRIAQLHVDGSSLTEIELVGGERVPCKVLYAHPPQHQVDVVKALGLDLDPQGYVQANPGA